MMAFEIATKNGDWTPLIVNAPNMARDLIAAATDTSEQEEIEAIAKLPIGVQITALSEIWKASVPDPKRLEEILGHLNASAKNAVKNLPPSVSNVATLPQVKEAS